MSIETKVIVEDSDLANTSKPAAATTNIQRVDKNISRKDSSRVLTALSGKQKEPNRGQGSERRPSSPRPHVTGPRNTVTEHAVLDTYHNDFTGDGYQHTHAVGAMHYISQTHYKGKPVKGHAILHVGKQAHVEREWKKITAGRHSGQNDASKYTAMGEYQRESAEQHHHVEHWYDKNTRSWVVQRKDKAGNQVGTADYVHSAREAKQLRQTYEKHNMNEAIIDEAKTTHTHKGHCQACGHQQAHEGAKQIAKHGYTTEHGYFSGTCPGSGHKPLEHSHELTDVIQKHLHDDAHKAREHSKNAHVTNPKIHTHSTYKKNEDGSPKYDRNHQREQEHHFEHYSKAPQNARDLFHHKQESRAKQSEGHARMLEDLKKRIHGTELAQNMGHAAHKVSLPGSTFKHESEPEHTHTIGASAGFHRGRGYSSSLHKHHFHVVKKHDKTGEEHHYHAPETELKGYVKKHKERQAQIASGSRPEHSYSTHSEKKSALDTLGRQYEKHREAVSKHFLAVPHEHRTEDMHAAYDTPYSLHHWRPKHSAAVMKHFPQAKEHIDEIERLHKAREDIASRPVIKHVKEDIEMTDTLDEGLKNKLAPKDAHDLLQAHGGRDADFHQLSSDHVNSLVSHAKTLGYRKSAGAPGSTGRMFHKALHSIAKTYTPKNEALMETDVPKHWRPGDAEATEKSEAKRKWLAAAETHVRKAGVKKPISWAVLHMAHGDGKTPEQGAAHYKSQLPHHFKEEFGYEGSTLIEAALEPHHHEALKRYAAKHGKQWKSKLQRDWETGETHGEDTAAIRQVRNKIGPSGLYRLKLHEGRGNEYSANQQLSGSKSTRKPGHYLMKHGSPMHSEPHKDSGAALSAYKALPDAKGVSIHHVKEDQTVVAGSVKKLSEISLKTHQAYEKAASKDEKNHWKAHNVISKVHGSDDSQAKEHKRVAQNRNSGIMRSQLARWGAKGYSTTDNKKDMKEETVAEAARMGMNPEHHELMKAAMHAVLNQHPNSAAEYKAKGLSAERHRWDVLHASRIMNRDMGDGHSLSHHIDKYANDKHIDTSLRHIIASHPSHVHEDVAMGSGSAGDPGHVQNATDNYATQRKNKVKAMFKRKVQEAHTTHIEKVLPEAANLVGHVPPAINDQSVGVESQEKLKANVKRAALPKKVGPGGVDEAQAYNDGTGDGVVNKFKRPKHYVRTKGRGRS